MKGEIDVSFLRASAQRVVDPAFHPILDSVLGKGKHARPWLGMRFCSLLGVDSTPLLDAFTGIELIHAASLVHDDIVDEDLIRRGNPSLHSRLGTQLGVLYGDYFFVAALQLLTQKKYSPRMVEHAIDAVKAMTRAQIMESSGQVDSLEKYWEYAHDKTAALMRVCATLPLEHYGLTHTTLEEFAQKYGLAFQVADDLSDFPEKKDEPCLPAFMGRESANQVFLKMRDELEAYHLIPAAELPFIGFEPARLEKKS